MGIVYPNLASFFAYDKLDKLRVQNGSENYNHLGNQLYQQGDLLGAQRCYLEAIAQHPDHAQSYYNLGVVLNAQGQLEKAQESYQTAIALKPDYLKAYSNLGCVLVKLNKISEAIAVYHRAIALNPHWATLQNNLGQALQAQGKLGEALSAYAKAIALQPDSVLPYYNAGKIWQVEGQQAEAIRYFQRCIELEPNHPSAYTDCGYSLMASGQLEAAMRCFQKAIALQPAFVESYCNWVERNLAGSLSILPKNRSDLSPLPPSPSRGGGNLPLSPPYSKDMIFLIPPSPLRRGPGRGGKGAGGLGLFSKLRWSPLAIPERPDPLDERDHAQISCAAFLQALQSNPDSPEVYSHIAQTYQHWGNVLFQYGGYEKAERYYHQSLQINPKNLTVYGQLSQCLAKQNRFNAAAVVSQMATLMAREHLKNEQFTPLPLARGGGQGGGVRSSGKNEIPLMEPPLSPDKISAELDNRSAEESLNGEGIALQRHTQPEGFYLNSRDWIESVKFEGSDYIAIHPGKTGPAVTPLNDLSNSPECGGLNCVPCLNRIYRQLSPILMGRDLYHFDSQNGRAIAEDSPPQFVVVVPQGRVWIVPQTNSWMVCNAIAVVTPDNYLLADVSRQYPGALPGCQKQDPTEHRIFERENLPPLTEIDGTVAVLAGLSGNVYFHWVVDILPRLEILRQAGINWEEIDYFLVNSIRQPFQRETLALLGIPETKIIESDRYPHISATRLIVPSFPGHLGWLEPWGLNFLRQTFLNSVPPLSGDRPERIYIRRHNARNRRLINEEEVIEFLAQFGFEPIETESLSFAEQIAVFSQAKIIVAPHGSGLTNLVFCRPGTQAIELVSPHYVRPYYAVICQLLGLSHYLLMGEAFACYPIREVMYQNSLTEDIQINVERLHALLKLAGIIKSNFSGAVSPTMQATFNSETAAEQLNQQAEMYLAQGKLDETESVCLKAIQIQPNLAASYKTLGNVFQRKGKIKEAEQSYLKAIKIQPNFAAAYANLGSLYGQQRQWDAAIASYQKAIKINPEFAGVYRNLAKVWTQLKKPAEAADCWYLAWSLEPEKLSAVECVNLGNALVQQREMTRAIACYRYALELNPHLVGVYHNLEEALKRQGKVEEAAIYGRKAVELGMKRGEFGQDASQTNGRKTGSYAWDEDAEALVHLGEYYYQKGKFAEAIAACEKAVSVQPNLAVAYKILGNARLAGRQLEAAQQCYLKALEIQPEFAEVYGNLGTVLAQQQNWEQAILAYQKALELQPTFAGAYRNLAKVLERVGKVQDAAICRYRAFSLEPLGMTAEDCLKLGNSLIIQGKQEEAIACYQRAVELNPQLSPAYHNLGEILTAKQEWKAAIAAYRQAIAVKAENGRSHYGLAKALVELERWEEAVKAYQQAIQLNVTSAEIYHQFGDALRKLQRWEEAARAYGQAIGLNADHSWSHNNLGDALIQLQQWEEAVVAYRRAIALNPAFHWSYYNLGEALSQLEQWDEAVPAYQQAVKLQPDLPWISQKLGDALRERAMSDLAAALGCYRQGIKEHPEDLQNYHKALEIQPDDAELYVLLANGLAKQGNSNGAIVFYQMALQLQPDNSVASVGLGQALLKKNIIVEHSKNLSFESEIYAQWWQKNVPTTSGERQRMTETIPALQYQPLLSIIMPVYNPPIAFLKAAIESVIDQIYSNWELCIADDASTDSMVRQVLDYYAAIDSRIKVEFRESNGHISAASNSALKLAKGEFLVLLDHDDLLTPDALYEVVLLLNRHPEADMIYSDEDKINEAGQLCKPFFKPDWCPDSFLSRMYTCHLGVYRRNLVEQIGGFRLGYEESQDYDLVLRLTEKTEKIFHIPKILYHWRMSANSTAGNPHAKRYAYEAAKRALQEAINRRGEPGQVIAMESFPGIYQIRYQIKNPKRVSIIIPTRNLGEILDRCLRSIFEKSTYSNYEVIVIDNGSDEPETAAVIEDWTREEPTRFKCDRLDIPFNYSRLNNHAVNQATGEYLLFLNNDTEVITPDWIEAMVEQAQRPSIGAVGALLLYPDRTIQHAGVILGIGGVAGHSHKHFPADHSGYFYQVVTTNNYSAVTGACLMCRRSVFEEVNGFEEQLAVAFNDVDFCLKIVQQGYCNIYLPHVVLYHHESKSRGIEDTPQKQRRFESEKEIIIQKWSKFARQDPCYSIHLTRDREDYSWQV